VRPLRLAAAPLTLVSRHDTANPQGLIKSFKDRRAQAIFEGRHPGKGFPADVIGRARRKLIMLDEA
jgi:hypothetical protein